MTTKDQAIEQDDDVPLLAMSMFLTKKDYERALDLSKRPSPDCRTCIHMRCGDDASEFCYLTTKCTNGDQYKPAPAVVLWRTE